MPPAPSPAPKGLRILCVDDDFAIRNLLFAILRRADHICEVAADGLEALHKISTSTEPFDLVVTDHQMPSMNGITLVESLRAAEFTGRIAVHSSTLDAPTRAAYETLRVDAFVDKPADATTLLRAFTQAKPPEPK